MFALFLALGIGAAGGYVLQRHELQLQAQTLYVLQLGESLAVQQRRVEGLDARASGYAEDLARAVVTVEGTDAHIQHPLADLHAQMGRTRSDWAAAEAAYVMGVANHRLQLLRDASTARIVLELADRRLAELGDPAFLRVREALRSEISDLDVFAKVDIVGLVLRPSTVIADAEQLPLAATLRAREREQVLTPNEPAGAAPKNWQAHLRGLWGVFKALVVVRREDTTAKPLLPPNAQLIPS
jgi:uroporphyrin-3 C-methyltransferase